MDRLLGTDVATAEQRALLERVGIASEPAPAGTPITVAMDPQPLSVDPGDAETIVAIVPSWRRDLVVEADVAEEVARVRGYDLVPSILPHTSMPAFRHDPLALRDAVRETLAGAGLTEAVTHALVSPAMVERFTPGRDATVPGEGEPDGLPITVTNPLSSQHSVMRQSVLGSLVEVVTGNVRHGRADAAIFEIGKGYGQLEGDRTHEWWRLGFVLTGAAEIPAWNRPARPYDLDDAKGLLELLAQRLGLPRPTYAPLTDDPILHPGRAAGRESPGPCCADGSGSCIRRSTRSSTPAAPG